MSLPIGFTNNLVSGLVLDIKIEPSIGINVKRLMTLDERLKNFREPLELAIREVMRPSIKKNFDVGGRPNWEPLADSTIKKRLKQGTGTKILVTSRKVGKNAGTKHLRTVASQRNIWLVGKTTAIIDGAALLEQVPYAGVHQAGAEDTEGIRTKAIKNERGQTIYKGLDRVPARPYLLIQEEDKVKIQEMFLVWLEQRIAIDWGGG